MSSLDYISLLQAQISDNDIMETCIELECCECGLSEYYIFKESFTYDYRIRKVNCVDCGGKLDVRKNACEITDDN